MRFAAPTRLPRCRCDECFDRGQVEAEAALLSAAREVYSGATPSEAAALHDRLEDLGYRVVRA